MSHNKAITRPSTRAPETEGPYNPLPSRDADLPPFSRHVVSTWLPTLQTPEAQKEAQSAHPRYWSPFPSTLLTASHPKQFSVGTGFALLSGILPELEKTRRELLFVTCFWAPSPSLTALGESLVRLSRRSLARGRRVRVRICFSSLSITQKVFHPSTYPGGKVWGPEAWVRKLGLPDPEELGGLEMEVRSIFLRPFSVLHAKVIVQDRRRAWVPSFNVSWEEWFEGCLELEGPVVDGLVEFYREVWTGDGTIPALLPLEDGEGGGEEGRGIAEYPSSSAPQQPLATTPFPHLPTPQQKQTPALILPSPHHQNPHFHPLSRAPPTPPPTPLNTFLLTLLTLATHSVKIYTPNLTSPPVLAALLEALKRGVVVDVTVPRKMMVPEQLATAGRTTGCRVRSLQREYTRLVRDRDRGGDIESGSHPVPGRLVVRWYHPQQAGGPVKSHIKLTVVDDEIAVLGSGNLDRASWWTSQEVGVVVFGGEVVRGVVETVVVGMGVDI